MEDEKRKALTLLIGLIVGAIVLMSAGGYLAIVQYVDDLNQEKQNQASVEPGTTQSQSDAIASWNTVTNSELAFRLQYPDNFFEAGDEPKTYVGNCDYKVFPDKCPDIVALVANEGQGIFSPAWVHPNGDKLTVANTNYCLYQATDAAAGHQSYADYYVTVKNQKCLVVELDSSTTTCENYLPLEEGNTEQKNNYDTCVTQRESRPKILDQIVNTFTFTN